MALRAYGVVAGRAVDRRREGSLDSTPHYQIEIVDDAGTHYRAAINVKSQQAPSELLYLADDNFAHPGLALLPEPGSGFTRLAAGPGGPNLDFIRGNHFDPAAMRLLPPDLAGVDNDLADLLDHYVQRAIADPEADVFVLGERFGPEATTPDKVFGFLPGNGIHDVHMNQGNTGAFARDNGVWQDGGLLIHLVSEARWVAMFLAFQSQAWHTDDVTGNALGGTPSRPQPGDASVRIVAALVNPVGPAPEPETITLINASPAPVDLTGWAIADSERRSFVVPGGQLAPGATLLVPTADGVQLGNKGGAITLLDREELKVDGVAYTADQARREGWTILF